MPLLHRYIFKQLLAAAAMAVGLFVFVLVVGNVLREVLDLLATGRLGWGTFFYLLAVLIPGVIPYALPLGLLTAVLLVVGRLSAQHEYTAMRASGLSLWTLAAPVLLLACLGVTLSLFINFEYAPAADAAERATIASLARSNTAQFLEPRTFIRDFPGYIIYVGDRDGPALRNFWVWVLDGQGHAVEFARAPRGHFTADPANDTVSLTLEDGFAERRDPAKPENFQDPTEPALTFQSTTYALSLNRLLTPIDSYKKISLMTLAELRAALVDGPPLVYPTPAQIELYHTRVQMQIQRHASGAFAVLAFALLGIPLGLKASRSETFVNLGLALALALIYYILWFLITLLEAHPNLHPDLLLWTPNLLYETVGLALIYRAARR
jgi:lipopolysaccharide export system permease protein